MSIRLMTHGDLPQVLGIQNALQFQSWNEKQFLAEINASYALCIVYEDSSNPSSLGSILGYAIFHIMGPDSELLSIAVKDECGRMGIGSRLLQEGFSRLNFENGDQCFLEVREGNLRARNFYEKQGFTFYAVRKNYYSDGENAILYKVGSN